ncbi:hypothetical protein DITRI_Ditri03aG0214100 [Diplodiscus trichospermus]
MQAHVQYSSTSVIKSSLIEPDGAVLVDLVVPESEREAKTAEAKSVPKVRLTKIDVQWVLAIDDEIKEKIGSSSDVGLVGPDGDLITLFKSIQVYKHNNEERIARTWGTTAPGLPYVEEVITSVRNWLIGGDLEVLKPIKYNDGLDHYRLFPKQLRKEFDLRKADEVFAFQLRNLVHNGHALLMNDTRRRLLKMGFKNPVLLLHPLGGFTKADDVPLDVWMEQHNVVLEDGVLDPGTTIVAIFPLPMHYAGPTEVQWHAKARINAGANFCIVGHDPAGMGHPIDKRDFCDPGQGKKVLSMALGLEKLNILPFRISSSSLEPRCELMQGPSENPPDGFMCPGGWEDLVKYYESLQAEKATQQPTILFSWMHNLILDFAASLLQQMAKECPFGFKLSSTQISAYFQRLP